MKKEISAFDLFFVVKEMQCLNGAKLEKVYHSKTFKNEILFRFYSKDHGKLFLRADIINNIYFTQYKDEYDSVSGFGMFLRKHLTNTQIKSIKQHEFDRVIDIEFEIRKKGVISKNNLIIELFGGGNIVLINEDNKILGLLYSQKWKDRTIHPGKTYIFPKPNFNPLSSDKNDFVKRIKASEKESIVKALASETALGGEYAEEVCARAELDKNLKINDLSDENIELLFTIIQNMKQEETKGFVYSKTITPFEFKTAKDLKKEYATFCEALDNVLTERRQLSKISNLEKKVEAKLSKIKNILKKQEKMYSQIKEDSDSYQKRAEKIYENYTFFDDLLKELKELKESKSWEEIKELFKKKHPSVIINEKNNEVVVDIK